MDYPYFCGKICFTRAFEPCERAEGAAAGGSVYLRSQSGRLQRKDVARQCKGEEQKVCLIKLHRDMEASWHGCRP